MKINYDPQADALYIKFQEGESARTKKVAEGIMVDLDEKGLLYGIEILGAKERMPLLDLGRVQADLPLAEGGAV
ncbi:MAG TPA: DUF2283 domain-containing protein [Candidatus Methylomirabilis sp.]|jgi:uncharacterized protein YuzE|nr:DUF2283 domain-containing protein [Candidatus Methylomirabilis sp.]